jgi:anaerobic magnesium-protoporphyrin IX monomethyl ester cyclase
VEPKVVLTVCPPFWHKQPPLGLAFLESTLTAHQIPVTVFDFNIQFYHTAPEEIKKKWLSARPADAEAVQQFLFKQSTWIDALAEQLGKTGASFYCFSLFAANRSFTLALVKKLKEHHPGVKVVVGGPQVLYESYCPSQPDSIFMECAIDRLVVGEGEKALLEIIQGRSQDRVVQFMEQENLNDIPYPTYRGFDIVQYHHQRTLPLLFSRGCLRRCAFCAECLLARRFRMRSAENMVEEILYHVHRHDTRNFIFHDSMINGDVQVLERFCDLLLKVKLDLKWEAQLMVRHDMSECLLLKMKAAGCYNLFIGLESGSDRVLGLMKKGFRLREATALLKKLKQAELHCEVSLIVDFPGETEDRKSVV